MNLGFTVAERVLYVPSIGFCVLLAVILEKTIDDYCLTTPADETEVVKSAADPVKSPEVKRTRSKRAYFAIAVAVLLVSAYLNRYLILLGVLSSYIKHPLTIRLCYHYLQTQFK